jgi:hypothetical protein
MKWITRTRVHVDRVACPWLIKRFVDPRAEFYFVTSTLVPEIAAEESAIPYDIKDVELGHHDDHCSFVSIMRKYELKDRALEMLADVVNAADTGKMDTNPYAPGLEAIAAGFSILYPDDEENIGRQFAVYDALYSFFKLKAAGMSKS